MSVNLIDSTNIEVTQSGNDISLDLSSEVVVDSIRTKNMLNLESWRTQTINGITFTNNGNGSITINGTATQDFGVNFVLFKIKAGNYYLSTNESSTLPNVFYLYDHDSNVGFGNGAITLSQDYNKMGFDTWVPNGTSFNNITISPQLETGSVGTAFAPYQNLDGVSQVITGDLTNLTTTDKSNLVGAINEINKPMYYDAWNNSISFELPIGRQALVIVNSDTNAVLLLWNPSDRLNSSAIFGNISAFNITRASNNTTITVTRKSGSATWTVLVLE